MAYRLTAIPHAPVFNASLRVILILVQFHGGRVWDGVIYCARMLIRVHRHPKTGRINSRLPVLLRDMVFDTFPQDVLDPVSLTGFDIYPGFPFRVSILDL